MVRIKVARNMEELLKLEVGDVFAKNIFYVGRKEPIIEKGKNERDLDYAITLRRNNIKGFPFIETCEYNWGLYNHSGGPTPLEPEKCYRRYLHFQEEMMEKDDKLKEVGL